MPLSDQGPCALAAPPRCRYQIFTLALGLLLAGCSRAALQVDQRSPSSLASVTVEEPLADWHHLQFVLTKVEAGAPPSLSIRLTPRELPITAAVKPGRYQVDLSFFAENGTVLFASELCPDHLRQNQFDLKPGPNRLSLPICAKAAGEVPRATPANRPEADATVAIEPKPVNVPASASTSPLPQAPATVPNEATPGPLPPVTTPLGPSRLLTLQDSQLLGADGQPIVLRGINLPYAYFPEESIRHTAQVKKLGFNAVRLVWCADTLLREGRCDSKDILPLSVLSRALAELRRQRLVGILNLQNATGSDDIADLEKMADYLAKPEVVSLLAPYQDMLLINIANEWQGSWNMHRNYVKGYQQVIPKLRAAGLGHVLVIDAAGYGQEFASLVKVGKELLALDKKLMLSAHMYDSFADANSASQVFKTARDQKWPFLVGEFACSHGDRGKVACEAIMEGAAKAKVGTMVWSLHGNSTELLDLNVLASWDSPELTEFGSKVVDGPYGAKATSREASMFHNL